jgi:hypothetical protein
MAVLDTGSSSTIIDKGFAQHLNLPIVKGPYMKEVAYIDRQASYETSMVAFELIGQDNQFRQNTVAETVEGFSRACFLVNWAQEIRKYSHLQGINVPNSPYPPLGVLLIGIDNVSLFEVFEKRVGTLLEPIGNLTPLGWAFMGNKQEHERSAQNFQGKIPAHNFKSQEDF